MAWWMLIPAAVSALSSISEKSSATSQNATQKYWNSYNAQQAYNTDVGNIAAQTAIAKANASLVMASANVNVGINQARLEFNKSNILEAAMYNDSLFADELDLLWEQAGLDTQLLTMQRARERGEIEADQSASGTVMGQDSNADVIIDQMTQEALDKLVVKHGADLSAKRVSDARARSLWEAGNEVKQIAFEGRMFEIATKTGAAMQSAGILTENAISGMAGMSSATSRLKSGLAGADMQYSQNQSRIGSNFRTGMFSAIGQGVSSYMNTMSATPAKSTTGVVSSYGNGGASGAGTSLITTQGMNWGGH
jgi:hypothetical protein